MLKRTFPFLQTPLEKYVEIFHCPVFLDCLFQVILKKKVPRTCQEYAMQQSDKLKDSSIRTNWQVEKDIREL